MFTTGETVDLAEWIIDFTFPIFLSPLEKWENARKQLFFSFVFAFSVTSEPPLKLYFLQGFPKTFVSNAIISTL